MIRILEISYRGHPVLGDLHLNFRRHSGEAADTIIIAGENGCGKSTVMSSIYQMISQSARNLGFEAKMAISINGKEITLTYSNHEMRSGGTVTYVSDGMGLNASIGMPDVRNRYPMTAVYSDVDINFNARELSSVTSLTLDNDAGSRRSSYDLSTMINQLIIDIQALDDADIAYAARTHPNSSFHSCDVVERMPRFTRAFDIMFENLSYDRVVNAEGHKAIMFKKDGIDVPIESLSSGEKQIVYRGCFLLKDARATDGAFVFVDEPEISLHPKWQSKIMDYYKAIFTDERGIQTSQIFVVTHSPFVVHRDNRSNDKVIVLRRGAESAIEVMSKPEYHICESVAVVQDAFDIDWGANNVQAVYLEGRTDERYFKSTVEAFDLDLPFEFRWIGYVDEGGQERNTGSSALSKAEDLFFAHGGSIKRVCLFDCDTNHDDITRGSVRSLSMQKFENGKEITKGIENALVLDSIDLAPFYSKKIKPDGYGGGSTVRTLDKMRLCDCICEMEKDERKIIFANLRDTIEKLDTFFRE